MAALAAVSLVLLAGLWNMLRGSDPEPEPDADALARGPAVSCHPDHDASGIPVPALTAVSRGRERREDRLGPLAGFARLTFAPQACSVSAGAGSRPMVVLNRIYTRTGDGGTTALGTGVRVPKHSQRIAAYGSVDETNAAIGMARQHLAGSVPGSAGPTGPHADLDAMLARIQNDLFDLGADLCAPEEPRTGEGAAKARARGRARGRPRPKRERLRVSEAQVARLEQEIDGMNASLPLFVPLSCRAVLRPPPPCTWRARSAAEPSGRSWRSPISRGSASALRCSSTLNRLSDLLFRGEPHR